MGYYYDLNFIFKYGRPKQVNYLFLGDYCGRGPSSIECIIALMCYKIDNKHNFFMLRGCNDTIAMARSGRLYDDCLERFSQRAWSEVTEVLCSLPFAAIVDEQLFCVHGGISPSLKNLE